MKLDLRTLPPKRALKGTCVLMRADWNIPMSLKNPGDSLKIERSMETIKSLKKRGAKLVIMTHLGRPKKRDPQLSTKRLVPMLKNAYGLAVQFHPEQVSKNKDREKLLRKIEASEAGSIHLLENVRFEKGEEKNDKALAKQYASLGELFVNDAFASCHRKHASVVGVAREFKKLSFAGAALVHEVKELSHILKKTKKPYVAVIGGKKLSTKIPFIKSLLKNCDLILIGGAMAAPFYRAQGYEIGKSFYEKESLKYVKELARYKKKILLPEDVMAVKTLRQSSKPYYRPVHDVGKDEVIVDVGPATLAKWASVLRSAKTIVWNGPLGITEFEQMGFGSRFIARMIASRTQYDTWTLAGGGDTIPVIAGAGVQDDYTFISTGGGALLEFVTEKGLLPGIQPLLK